MSSILEFAVTSIQDNNYVTLIILTAVGYDYVLTFPYEIEYVWGKPWTWVSTLFVLVRYLGLCGVTIYSLSKMLTIAGTWAMFGFIAAADLVMILRVWALYARSRGILGVLLTLYVMEIAPYIAACIILSIPSELQVVTIQVLQFSYCAEKPGSSIWATVNDSLEFALAATMFLLVAARFACEAFQMYRITKRWQIGRYTKLFAREGMLYFLAMLLLELVNVLNFAANIPTTGWRALVIGTLEYVPVFTLTPRFILSMRELYARDLRGRSGPCDIDTGFGLASVGGRGASVTAMVFADVGQNEEGLEQDGEIPMVERGVQSTGSDA